jgi:hypothetical protein
LNFVFFAPFVVDTAFSFSIAARSLDTRRAQLATRLLDKAKIDNLREVERLGDF